MFKNEWFFFTLMRIKILALTCKRRLQWKKLRFYLRLLFTSLNMFWTISALILSRDWKDVCDTHIWEQSQIFEIKKLGDNSEFEKKCVWWHILVKKNWNFLRNLISRKFHLGQIHTRIDWLRFKQQEHNCFSKFNPVQRKYN